jgi:hypothetical protein
MWLVDSIGEVVA